MGYQLSWEGNIGDGGYSGYDKVKGERFMIFAMKDDWGGGNFKLPKQNPCDVFTYSYKIDSNDMIYFDAWW